MSRRDFLFWLGDLPSPKWLGYFQGWQFEFENWAMKQLNGRASKIQIGDMGIDDRIYPVGTSPREAGADELALEESWYPIQVKQNPKPFQPVEAAYFAPHVALKFLSADVLQRCQP